MSAPAKLRRTWYSARFTYQRYNQHRKNAGGCAGHSAFIAVESGAGFVQPGEPWGEREPLR